MQTDMLVLSDVGLHAINNASAGGLLVDATGFKIGDSRLSPKSTEATDILGNTLFSGTIHHVEVLNKNVARFVFEVQSHQITQDTVVHELGIFLSNNILLGRAVFADAITLIAGENTRFNCLLATSRADLTTLNVTIGDYSGLASTPFVHQLQSPHESTVNAVTVLNGLRNYDGSDSPLIAMRHAGGSFQWAFSDHTRIFNGRPNAVTPTTITINGLELEDGDVVLVHVISGTGAGQTRRYGQQGNRLVEIDDKPLTLTTTSNVAVWKRIFSTGTLAPSGLPNGDNIPSDWVLTRGGGDQPVWAPPKTGGASSALLWSPPSKLRLDVINYTGTGDKARYTLGKMELDNVNYVQPNLGGVMQHRAAFDMLGNEIEFTEFLPVGLALELRMFSRVASNGSRMIVKVDHFVGDGVTQTYKLSQKVENANYVKVYVRGVAQLSTTFTYDEQTQEINLIAPIHSGMAVEVRSFAFEDAEGYSTQILSHVFTTREDTQFIELPFFPQSADYIEVSQSGAHVHGNLYTLIGNKVILSGSLRRNTEVEVICYDNKMSLGSSSNNLPGVVTDAVLSGHSLKLLRHGAPPVSLPIPGVSLQAGPGIRITGKHPFYVVESTLSDQLTDAGANFKVSDQRTLQDTTEIIFTHRVQLSRDLLLTVHADFSAVLGPGFQTLEGLEIAEYVVGFRTSKSQEVDYGRQLPGTGTAGFNSLAGGINDRAYANASLTQVYEVIAQNHPAGYIDVVVKMRILNANVGQYSSLLTLNVNVLGNVKVA